MSDVPVLRFSLPQDAILYHPRLWGGRPVRHVDMAILLGLLFHALPSGDLCGFFEKSAEHYGR
jgi:hypothetical protein